MIFFIIVLKVTQLIVYMGLEPKQKILEPLLIMATLRNTQKKMFSFFTDPALPNVLEPPKRTPTRSV